MPTHRWLPLFTAVLLLVGCTPRDHASTDPPPAEPAVETESTEAAEEAQAEPVVELGEFNAEHDEFVVFDPCTEIPRDVLDAAGLGEMVSEPFYSPMKSVTCSFRVTPQNAKLQLVTTTGDINSKLQVRDQGFMIAEEAETEIPGVYLHHMGEGTEDSCTAAVHTTRGRWTVTYIEGRPVPDRGILCERAVDYLETTYFQLGEENGSTT